MLESFQAFFHQLVRKLLSRCPISNPPEALEGTQKIHICDYCVLGIVDLQTQTYFEQGMSHRDDYQTLIC